MFENYSLDCDSFCERKGKRKNESEKNSFSTRAWNFVSLMNGEFVYFVGQFLHSPRGDLFSSWDTE